METFMLPFKLERPLAVFDLEATGTSPRADRIVEISIVRIMPDHSRKSYNRRINPRIPIPEEATAIHGITNEDVAECPVFPDVAQEIYGLLEECDLCGYNVLRFDIPMLVEEFLRAEIEFDIENRRIIDAQRIYHRREPRDLTAALSFYCGEMHLDAHGAEADVLATIRVLEGQFMKYKDLPEDMDELHEYCNPRDPTWVDRTGRLKWRNSQIVLNFGRMKGKPLKDIIENDSGFIKWMLRSDFPRDTKQIIHDATQGKWPQPPSKK